MRASRAESVRIDTSQLFAHEHSQKSFEQRGLHLQKLHYEDDALPRISHFWYFDTQLRPGSCSTQGWAVRSLRIPIHEEQVPAKPFRPPERDRDAHTTLR